MVRERGREREVREREREGGRKGGMQGEGEVRERSCLLSKNYTFLEFASCTL